MKDPFAAPRALRIKPLQVTGIENPIDLVDGRLTIGRADDNDLVLPAEVFPSVSTHHLRLELADGKLWVDDLGSRNGTLVNGQRVERQQLVLGDVVQLGAIGPRFVVVSTAPLSETMFVDPKSITVSEGNVEDMVHRRARRQTIRIALLGTIAVAAVVWWGLDLASRGQTRQEESDRKLQAAGELIEQLQLEIREGDSRYQAHVADLEATVRGREGEAADLRTRLANLEASGASGEEIKDLKDELERTRSELHAAEAEFAKFDPVNLEASRLSGVSRVREAVVLIEAEMTLVNEDGKALHLHSSRGPNWDDEGEPWTLESTGTGFCISEDGFVLTNAHVIDPPPDHPLVISARQNNMEARMTLRAVFSTRSKRHDLVVISRASGVDLALAKIEPFEGMPFIADFTTTTPPPPPGSDVYLLGFPLGNFALQEGRRVIASTFRGILSRVVGDNIQVDAGVHPGNSGGPITDRSGRVVGVVVSVQATPEQTAVYTIGYGIPIALAAQLWPPPTDGDESTEEVGD